MSDMVVPKTKTPVLRSAMTCTITPPWFVNKSEYPPVDAGFELLINGKDAFASVHHAIAAAKKSVSIICWGFQPSMYFIRDGKSPSIGQLLAQKAEEGVQVRVLCWNLKLGNVTGYAIGEANTPGRWDLGKDDRPATSTDYQQKYDEWWFKQYDEDQGPLDDAAKDLRALFGDKRARNLDFIGRGFSSVDRAKIGMTDYDDEGLSAQTKGLLSGFPSHHQKMVLVDHEDPGLAVGFVMGHNMLDEYWDTSDHSAYPRTLHRTGQPDPAPNAVANGKLPRHDFSSKVTGPILGNLYSNFAAAWIKATWKWLPKGDFSKYPVRTDGQLQYIMGQILRTQPQYGTEDIKLSYFQAVNNASRYIHIENQYFRWPPLAEKIKAAAAGQGACGRRPEKDGPLYLFVITNSADSGIGPGTVNSYRMLDALGRADTIPGVARAERMDNLDARIGQAEQELGRLEGQKHALDTEARLLQGIPNVKLNERYADINSKIAAARAQKKQLEDQKAAIEKDADGKTIVPEDIPGLKCHICTLVAPDTKDGEAWMEVYIHAKLMLIDDTFMTLGSANINTRSMQVDSELNIAHHRPEITRPARQKLWGMHTHHRTGGEGMGTAELEKAYKGRQDIMDENHSRKGQKFSPTAPLTAFLRTSPERKNLD